MVECDSLVEEALSTQLYFLLYGSGGSFGSGLKSQPESPSSLTQLPAILRGWIEFLGYSRECLLKAVSS
jgi:hypothetical protein